MKSRAIAALLIFSVLTGTSSIFSASASKNNPNTTVSSSRIVLKPRTLAQKSSVAISPTAKVSHVVVKFKDENQVRLRGNSLRSFNNRSIKQAESVLSPYLNGQRLKRSISTVDEEKLDRERDVLQYRSRHELADLNSYYKIEVSSVFEAEQLINQLNRLDEIEVAYLEPTPEPAGSFEQFSMVDYTSFQDYREVAPAGVDADYANTLPGGDGSGIMIVDIEGAWRDTHEDLGNALGGLLGGSMINDLSWRNHGTAVLGEMIGSNNGLGVTGISYGADAGMASIGSFSLTEAFLLALDTLKPGDLILIELHAPGPHFNFQSRPDQLGYICMEYWPENFDVIQYAWAKGIIVVEAAGNGAENFDDGGLYGQLFDTTFRNSHAIIAGAGYPAASAQNLQRQGFSNYGERVNLQGYGSGVYSTGYGNLAGGSENSWYTSSFSGTSSASPIVTGAIACLQGHYKSTYGSVLTSDQVRELMNATGTPQVPNGLQHIGPRPNLFTAIAAMPAPVSIYATPILVDTTITVGSVGTKTVWLHNRSNSLSFDYSINDNDSMALSAANWLETSPGSGTISPLDSVAITVTLDATVIDDASTRYKGILEVSWGISGGLLDSLSLVPVYLTVPCGDSSYEVLSSTEVGGPTFNWISAKTLGFKIVNSNLYTNGSDPKDDGSTGPWPIRFNFPFYHNFVDSVYLGVNGGLSFTDTLLDPSGFFEAHDIPGTTLSSFVSAFWNDLIFNDAAVPDAGLYIYWNATKDTAVIEWYRPSNFNSPSDTLTNFEIVLTKDGNILFQYQNVGTTGLNASALTGISEVDCKALGYFDGGDIPAHQPANGRAVRFKNLLGEYIKSGDMNSSGTVNILDLNALVAYVFNGGPAPNPVENGDVNCSNSLNVLDLNYLVAYVFNSGPAPCGYFRYF